MATDDGDDFLIIASLWPGRQMLARADYREVRARFSGLATPRSQSEPLATWPSLGAPVSSEGKVLLLMMLATFGVPTTGSMPML